MKRLLAALLLLPAAGCLGPYTHKLSDPTLVLQTRGGTELGVSTEYGVVFLGRTARSGQRLTRATSHAASAAQRV